MAFHLGMPWNDGEEKMHELTKVTVRDNPNTPGLSPRAAHMIQIYPLMAVGTLDPQLDSRPWTSIWGGESPMAQAIAAGGVIGIKTKVDATHDPVVNVLLGKSADGEVVNNSQGQTAAMVSALSIDLESRGRMKLFGRMIAGALDRDSSQHQGDAVASGSDQGSNAGNAQVVLKIEQSLGNCPKYLNKKHITPYPTLQPKLLSEDIILSQEAIDLISNADSFFMSSSYKFEDMDTNHRGGSPGFIRVRQPSPEDEVQATTIVWPEYSGNNLYQSLGNLMATPRAGIAIPNYSTGDVLYLTGDTKVLVNNEANDILPKSKLAVQLTIVAARLVQNGLSFRGEPINDGPSQGLSPYNPRIRFLRSEREAEFTQDYSRPNSMGKIAGSSQVSANLIKKTNLSPTITKYRFSLSDPAVFGPWSPGQYVALDLSEEMDMGYSHMRDDDPGSLNDDYIRTFTVASPPNSLGVHGEEFEVMIRKVGTATSWLNSQREGLVELGVLGFGGDFTFGGNDDEKRKSFVAQGIGITPLLGQIGVVRNLKVFWTVNVKDAGVVVDVVKTCSDEIKSQMVVYLTGNDEDIHVDYRQNLDLLSGLGIQIERRRMIQDDLTRWSGETDEWFMCASPEMRKIIQEWLPEKSIVFENFDY